MQLDKWTLLLLGGPACRPACLTAWRFRLSSGMFDRNCGIRWWWVAVLQVQLCSCSILNILPTLLVVDASSTKGIFSRSSSILRGSRTVSTVLGLCDWPWNLYNVWPRWICDRKLLCAPNENPRTDDFEFSLQMPAKSIAGLSAIESVQTITAVSDHLKCCGSRSPLERSGLIFWWRPETRLTCERVSDVPTLRFVFWWAFCCFLECPQTCGIRSCAFPESVQWVFWARWTSFVPNVIKDSCKARMMLCCDVLAQMQCRNY